MIRRKSIFVFTPVLFVILLSVASNSSIAETEVIGFIEQDTTWTQANSPYRFEGPIVANKRVTLTIEPGVAVDFNGHDLEINGALIVRGTDSNNPSCDLDFYGKFVTILSYNPRRIWELGTRNWEFEH
jgi:hypothetical protein